MNLGRMTWRDFQSYQGEHEIDWGQIGLACVVGPNGAGKSTLVDAIRWVLFGATREAADGVINRDAESCEVGLEFRLGDLEYGVRRLRTRKGGGKSSLSFWTGADRRTLDGKTARETEAKIAGVLGMDDALFCATACASQGEAAAFAEASASERKGILGRILALEKWDVLLEISRREASRLDGALEPLRGRRDALAERAGRVEEIREGMVGAGPIILASEEIAAKFATEVEDLQEQKVALATEVAEDRAARERERDLNVRRDAAIDQHEASEGIMADLEKRTADAEEISERCAKAEAAQAEVDRMAEARADGEKLDGLIAAAVVAAETAVRDRAATGRRLMTELKALQDRHTREVERVHGELEGFEKAAALLGEVPCDGDSFIAEACKLLAQARDAAVKVAPTRQALHDLEHSTPTADEEVALQAFHDGTPLALAPLEAAVTDLRGKRAEIIFDAVEEKRTRLVAQHAPALRDMVTIRKGLLEQIPASKKGEEAARLHRDALTRELDALRKDLGPATDWAAQESALGKRLQDAITGRDVERAGLADLREKLAGLKQRLEAALEAKAEHDRVREEILATERRRDLQQMLSNPRSGAFSAAGIPALLIEQAVPELEQDATEILGLLSGGGMGVALRSQRETGDKKLIEVLDIIVADTRGERPYESYSGGERMRVDLAFRIALSTMLARRANARCEFLVLDETAAPLDAEGRQIFAECLMRIADRFSTVLAVSHVPDLQDALPTRIIITKGPEGSRLEVIG